MSAAVRVAARLADDAVKVGSKILTTGAKLGSAVSRQIVKMSMKPAAQAQVALRASNQSSKVAVLKSLTERATALAKTGVIRTAQAAAIAAPFVFVGSDIYSYVTTKEQQMKEDAFYMDDNAAALAYGAQNAEMQALRSQMDNAVQKRRDAYFMEVFLDREIATYTNEEVSSIMEEVYQALSMEYFSNLPDTEYMAQLVALYREVAAQFPERNASYSTYLS